MSARARVFWLFTSAYFLSYFYRSANAVIAPDLSAEMALGAGQLGLMTSLFFATFALAQLPLGVALDRWGPRWVTPGLMLVGAAGSAAFALAPGFGALALGRGLIGVGMAGVLMGSLKAFSRWYPAERFATVSGLLVGIGSTGAMIAATPLAWLNSAVGWRTVFVLVGAATVLIALAISTWTRSAPDGAPAPVHDAEAGHLGAVFADLRFWRMAPLAFFMAGTLLGFQGLWAGPYLFDVLHLDAIAAGNVLLMMGVGVTCGFVASGWLADRFGLPRTVALMAVLFVAAQAGLALRPPLAMVAGLYLAFGFSGAFNIMLLAHARHAFPAAITGQAVTAVNLFGIGGTFVLQWAMGLIIGTWNADAAGHYPPEAYTAVLACTAVGAALTLLWYLPLARRTG